MNKTDLIQKLKTLEGLTAAEKADLINLVNTNKKYGLVWEDKPEEVEEQLRQHLPVLQEVVEKRILASQAASPTPAKEGLKAAEKANPSLFAAEEALENLVPSQNPINPQNPSTPPNHILIEGDNLHALTALSFTHEGKIDVIYIDPPYNTGKENEFRYNDKWILEGDPFRHSTWLSFVIKRLKIAKSLLSETGVIIIHIDENEFDALNLLLETEIFSEENSLGQIIWNKQNPKGDAKEVASMHEYILIYCKNIVAFKSMEDALLRLKPNAQKILKKAKKLFSKMGKTEVPEEIREVMKPFNFQKDILKDFEVKYDLDLINKEFQSWLSRQDFSGGEKAYKFIDKQGQCYRGVSMAWPNKEVAPDDYWIPLVHPITGQNCPVPNRGWRNPSTTMKKLIKNDLILFGEDELKQPERKYLLAENISENTPSIFNCGASDDDLFNNLKISFPYPKPVEVAGYFLQSIHPNPKSILDFFAGSGTTLHATMQLNAEDGGNRQCILVTNNENNICEEVTYERNKRVIQGYTNAKGLRVEGLGNNNLRYYQSLFVPASKSEANKRLLTNTSTDLLCIKEDCYDDITEAQGFSSRQCRIFTNAAGQYLLVIYHSRQLAQTCEALIAWTQALPPTTTPIKLYAFSPEKDTLAEDFAEVADRIEAVPLPEAIYNAYRATFKTLKIDRQLITPEQVAANKEPELFDGADG